MKRKIALIFLCLTVITNTLQSQATHPVQKFLNDSTASKYLNFLKFPNQNSQNYLITANIQLMGSPVGKTLEGNGIVPNVGINFGRLFSRKIIFGITFEWKIVNGVFPEKPSQEFVSDFNASYNNQYDTPKDSANAFVVKNAINNGFVGSQMGNIGIMFSILPQKCGGILIQVKKGWREFGINSHVYGNKYIENGGRDYYNLGVNQAWSCEMSLKPLAFFHDTYIMKGYCTRKNIANRIILSFYYEKLDFRGAEFNGTLISRMVTNSFMNKYAIDNRFGFKLGIAIY